MPCGHAGRAGTLAERKKGIRSANSMCCFPGFFLSFLGGVMIKTFDLYSDNINLF